MRISFVPTGLAKGFGADQMLLACVAAATFFLLTAVTDEAFADSALDYNAPPAPVVHHREISESLSVTSIFDGPAPARTFVRSLNDGISVSSSFPSAQQVQQGPVQRGTGGSPAPFAIQRTEERLNLKNLSNTKADVINGKGYGAGTPTNVLSEYDTGSMIVTRDPVEELESILGDSNADDSDHSSAILSVAYPEPVELSPVAFLLNSAFYSAFGVGAIVIVVARSGPAVVASRKIKRVFVSAGPLVGTGNWYATRVVIIVLAAAVAIAVVSSAEPLFGVAFADTNAAAAAYRSNTGTNGLNSPKYREWDPSTSTWSSEVELATTGAGVRDAKLLYSPTSSLRAIVTLSASGDLHLYYCTSSCTNAGSWTGPTSIANVGSLSSSTPYRPFDIAFEQSSGKLVIVYDKSVTETDDFYWKTFDGSTLSSESGFNYVGTTTADNPEIRYFRLASKVGSNELAMILLDATNARSDAFIWDGSTFGNSTSVSSAMGTTSITGESIGIAYERSSGAAVAFSANGADATIIQRWLSPSWSSITPSVINTDVTGNHVTFVTMKSDPVSTSNKIMICVIDSSGDGACAQEDGGAIGSWNIVTAATPSTARRGIDFAWNASGSTGVVVFSETNSATVAQQWTGSSWGSVVTSTTSVGGTQVNDLFPQGGGGAQGTSKTATVTGLTITTTGATNAKLIVKQIMRFGQATTVTPGTVSVSGAGAGLAFGTGSASIVAGAGTKTQTLQTILPFSTTGAINAVSIGTISIALSLNPGVSAPNGTIASGSSPTAPPEVVGGTQTNTLTPSLGGTQTNTVTTTSTTAKTATATGITVTTGGATTGTITITQTVTLSNTATITGTPTVSQTGTPGAGLSLGTPTVTVLPTSSTSTKTITITQPFTTAGAVTEASIGTLSVSFTLGTARTASIATASGSPSLSTTEYSSASSGVTASTTGAVSGTILLQQSITFSGATNVTPGSVSITGTGAGLTLGTATPSIVSGAGTATQVLQISIPFSTTSAISSVSLGTVSVPLTLDTSQSITSISIPSGYPTTLIDDGRWIVSAGNPTTTDTARSLWLTLDKTFKITSSKYDGTNLSTLGLHTNDASVSTFEGMSIDFQKTTTTSHSRSPSDTLTVTDSAARKLIALRSIFDSVTISDSSARVYLAYRTASDSVTVSDSITIRASRAISDSVTIADSAARTLLTSRSAADTVTLADAIARALATSRSASDSVTISDSITAGKAFDRPILDSLTLADSVVMAVSRSITDSTAVVDSVSLALVSLRSVSDTATITDSISTAVSRNIAETVTVADTILPQFTIQRSVSDTLSIVDSVARALVASRSASDSVGITDSITVAYLASRSVSDSVAITDTITAGKHFDRSISDSTAITDSPAATYLASRSISDATAISDSIDTLQALTMSIDDTLNITDSVPKSLGASRSTADTITIQDAVEGRKAFGRAISDSLAMTEDAARALGASRFAADTASVTDSVERRLSARSSLSDAVAITEQIAAGKAFSRSITDALTISDNTSMSVTRSIAETLTVSDMPATSLSTGRAVTDSLSVTDAISINVGRSLSDNLTVDDEASSSTARTVEDTLIIVDAISKAVSRQPTEKITISDNISIAISRQLSDSLVATDSINVLPSRQAEDSVTVADEVSIVITKPQQDEFAIADTISTHVTRSILEELSIEDGISLINSYTVPLSDSLTVEDRAERAGTAVGSAEDSLVVEDAISIHAMFYLDDSVTITDSIIPPAERSASDSLTISDEITASYGITVAISDSIAVTAQLTEVSWTGTLSFAEPLTLSSELCTPSTCNHNLSVPSHGLEMQDSLNLDIAAVRPTSDSVSLSDSVHAQIVGILVLENKELIGPMPSTPITGTTYTYTGNAADLKNAVLPVSVPINGTVSRPNLPGQITILRTYSVPVAWTSEIPTDNVIMSESQLEVPAYSNMFMRLNFNETPELTSHKDFMSMLDIEFTPKVDSSDFGLVVSMTEKPASAPTPTDELKPLYIDVRWWGTFPGAEDPSVQDYYQNPPTFTFTVNDQWVQENDASRDADGWPALKLWLLNDGTNQWEQITAITKVAAGTDGTYTFSATLPHFSNYAITANVATSAPAGPGGNGSQSDRETFAVQLADDLFVEEGANMSAVTIIEEFLQGRKISVFLSDLVTVKSKPVVLPQEIKVDEDITVEVSLVEVRQPVPTGLMELIKMLTRPSAVAEIRLEITNTGEQDRQFEFEFTYNDARGELHRHAVELEVNGGTTLTREVEIPFTEPGIYNVTVIVRDLPAGDVSGFIGLTVEIPWLALQLNALYGLAATILAVSGLALLILLKRPDLLAVRRRRPEIRLFARDEEEFRQDNRYQVLARLELRDVVLSDSQLKAVFALDVWSKKDGKEFVVTYRGVNALGVIVHESHVLVPAMHGLQSLSIVMPFGSIGHYTIQAEARPTLNGDVLDRATLPVKIESQ